VESILAGNNKLKLYMATHRIVIDMTLIYPNSSKRKSPCAYLKIGRSIIYWTTQAQNLFDAAQEAFDGTKKSREAGNVKST
jgi:hypothetical protein